MRSTGQTAAGNAARPQTRSSAYIRADPSSGHADGDDPAGRHRREQLELALVAERHGWDGVFVWEAAYGVDAWGLLSAIAVRTDRVRLGTLLTPLPWRRPWKVASQVATLDQLSGGRAILTVGLGAVSPDLPETGEGPTCASAPLGSTRAST